MAGGVMEFYNWLKTWEKAEAIQLIIAIIYAFTVFVLWLNFHALDKQLTETRKQANAAQRQVELTQTLNQPLCAVKELKVDKARSNVVQISPVIKNFGKMVEMEASFQWKIDIIKNFNDDKKWTAKNDMPWRKKDHIKILPEQEFIVGFKQYNTFVFNNMVSGYDSAILVSMIIGYHDLENKPQQYSCSYLITRFADIKKDEYEVILREAK
jgi:hypothetical protein